MRHGERFNAISHLAGTALALAGGIILIVLASRGGDAWKVTSVSIYSATLVLLFTFSTLYHGLSGKLKGLFQKFDHQSIYLLIAGSYTPFCLVTLRGTWGWSLFGTVWGMALLGMLQEFFFQKTDRRRLSLVIYVVMGWAVVAAIVPLIDTLGTAGLLWLGAGGLCYTGGIVFYIFDDRFRHWHGIWHLFVLAGGTMHYIAVLLYVL
ncbi:MAG: PAQR family membrane homeostasis protein TrhA [Betaproteobacteria bacterium]